MTDLGLVGIVDKGEYSAAATYNRGNFVYYNGSTYLCLLDDTHNILPTINTNWRYLAKGFDAFGAVMFNTVQTLSESEQDRARQNINAQGDVFLSVSDGKLCITYND